MTGPMFAALQSGNNTQHLWTLAGELGIAFLAVLGLAFFFLRKFFQNRREEHKQEFATSAPRTENPSAFMAASMQGVIQKLREQEKELERLHKIEKERAEQTERLSEEVTRNMPAGLLVAECLSSGKIYRREEVEHLPPAGDTRHLGVTISPIRRGTESISGVICLLTDLTELAALQQRMQLKENLA